MAKKQNSDWLQAEIQVEKWVHKYFHFTNDIEFSIFLIWALFVSVFFLAVLKYV